MADVESLRQSAQVRIPFSTWLGVVLLFALFGIIVLAVIGPSPRGDNYERTRAKGREEKLKKLHEEDTKALTTYGWIDQTKGVARLPIDRAMELTVVELAQKKPTRAGPIATPETQASTTASPTPSGGASPSPQPSPPKPTSVSGVNSELGTQPAAAGNPPPAPPGTQPGAGAAPPAGASPGTGAEKPPVSPSPPPLQSPPGSPLPVRGKSPGGF